MSEKITLSKKIEIFENFAKTGEKLNGQTIYEGYPIGQWAIQIRSALKNGKEGVINPTEEQLEKMSELGILERQIDSTIDEKIEALIEWNELYPDIEIERKYANKKISEKTLNKLKELAERTGEDYLKLEEKYKKIQSYNEYVTYRNYQGKLTNEQKDKCKEANLGKRFGYSSEIVMLSRKYHLNEDVVYDICENFGNVENFIKAYREGTINDDNPCSYAIDYIDTRIDRDLSENRENYSKLVRAIDGIYDKDIYLFSSKAIDETLKTLVSRENQVLVKRFGLDDGRTKGLDEVAQEFNITRERVRQYEAKGLRKLRVPFRRKMMNTINIKFLKENKFITEEEKEQIEAIEDKIWNSNIMFKGDNNIELDSNENNDYETNFNTESFSKIMQIVENVSLRKEEEKAKFKIADGRTSFRRIRIIS